MQLKRYCFQKGMKGNNIIAAAESLNKGKHLFTDYGQLYHEEYTF